MSHTDARYRFEEISPIAEDLYRIFLTNWASAKVLWRRFAIKGTVAWNIFIPEYAPNQCVY